MKILVVEDNLDIKEVLGYILKDDGHEVVFCLDGSSLTTLDTIKPDLILLDDKNPRSILFQIKQLVKHFEKLPKERTDAAGAGKIILLNCLLRLERSDARELAGPPAKWADSEVAGTIRETLRMLPQISDAIAASYFAHSAISRTGRGTEE